MSRFDVWKWVCAVVLLCTAIATVASAQATFMTLVDFNGADGTSPIGALVQGSDGDFYGATMSGGANCVTYLSCGTLFKVTAEGELTTLYNFCELANCADGANPDGPLMQASNGKFYGTTSIGNAGPFPGCGTVFELSLAGTLTRSLGFGSGLRGCTPSGGLIQAANRDLYGTTQGGGDDLNPGGTVFRVDWGGTLNTLYSFCNEFNCRDGENPTASLMQATNGNLYGTTPSGGPNHNSKICASSGCGTIFRITLAGALGTFYSFCSLPNCADGSQPEASLVQTTDGNFYGTAYGGGAFGGGTVFKITSTGKLTTIYSFCSSANCADGAQPLSLIQATDGNFYGTTFFGGINNYGTVFRITPAGTLTTLYRFCSLENCTDGISPSGGLLQANSGIFYGTTGQGGPDNDGTIFSLDTGLGPFVAFLPSSAKIGQPFGILGQELTGTTNVSLNGIPASYIVKSDTLLIATVPAGASTGYVTVTTPNGALTSNVPFYVIK